MADKRSGGNNGWSEFMQSREIQLFMYGAVVVFCVYYAIDAVRELTTPERSAVLMEAMGSTAYYVVTVLRAIVCLGTGVAFARIALRIFRDKQE